MGKNGAPSQALPRQLPRRGSQAVKFSTKVLGIMRKFPAVLLALPLGELSPKVTERAHAVSPIAKVLDAMRNLPGAPEAPSQRELALLKPYLEEARNKQNVEDIYMLLTDVPKEESVVICNGRYAAEVLSDGFDTQPAADASWTLPGVVSRKKQFIPALMTAYQEL